MKTISIALLTGKPIRVIPINRYSVMEKCLELYNRVERLLDTKLYNEKDTRTLKYFSSLLMESIMYYNYRFSASNQVGKDVEYNKKEERRIAKLIKAGKF